MRSGLTFAALWVASIAGAVAVQHSFLRAPVDVAFLLLATVGAGVTLGSLEWLARTRRARAEAQSLRDQQIAFLVAEAVRQRRALDRVSRSLLTEGEAVWPTALAGSCGPCEKSPALPPDRGPAASGEA